MSCYYHPKVPTLTLCPDCGQELCATCAADSICPGCRLGRAMRLTPSQPLSTERVNTASQSKGKSMHQQPDPQPAQPAPKVTVTDIAEVGDDDRVLAALSYPLWPVALFLLALRGRMSAFVRYHSIQALLVNALGVGAYFVYSAAASLPVVGWQSALVLPILLPAWFIINLYLGIRAYGGHVTRVQLAADYAQRHAQI